MKDIAMRVSIAIVSGLVLGVVVVAAAHEVAQLFDKNIFAF